MRTNLDFTPLFRSSVGFDRILNLLESAGSADIVDSWPPYDILKNGEDDYRISVAVAGFSEDELTVMQEHNVLVVSGQKSEEQQGEYLHRGFSGRKFQRRFQLADHVKVVGAGLSNGVLTIDLKREIPETMKPRRIAIEGAVPQAQLEAPVTEPEKVAA
jgi:molecular chaperone IbpA